MRIAAVTLALTILGCKSQPAASAPPPQQELVYPLNPEVLRPRPDLSGGIAVEPVGEKPQLRPERVVLLPDERSGGAVDVDELYQQAYIIRDAQPAESARLFEQVLRQASKGTPTYEKAKNQLAAAGHGYARELFLLGYQLKDSQPDEAARLFAKAMDLSTHGDATYEKAKAQLARMKP